MAEPLTIEEQLRQEEFVPDHKLVVCFITTKFDQVWLKNSQSGEIEQGVPNVASYKQDCDKLRSLLERYDVSDTGANDLYLLDNDPTSDQVQKVADNIKQRLSESPRENFLIVYIIAGQGMEHYGQQIMLLNEFNDKTGFYKHWAIENDIREIASTFPNSYQVAMFAASRQIMRASIHSGGFGGSKQEADEHFSKAVPNV